MELSGTASGCRSPNGAQPSESRKTDHRRRLFRLCLPLGLFALVATPAFAAEGKHGPSEFVFVAQLALLMLVGRLLGEIMICFKQPGVMGQLIAGLVLGPSLLGLLFPDWQHAIFPSAKEQKAMLDGVSQFGVLMLFLLTGMETDLKLVRRTGAASVIASIAGIVIPSYAASRLAKPCRTQCCPILENV